MKLGIGLGIGLLLAFCLLGWLLLKWPKTPISPENREREEERLDLIRTAMFDGE